MGSPFSRWLKKYQRDRAAHSKARRGHSDPMALDADFAQVVKRMGIVWCRTRLAELRPATGMLLDGARVSTEHFRDYYFSSFNTGNIVDLLE